MRRKIKYGRLFTVWLLMAVYVLTLFRVALPYVSYKLNYHYISTTLCENKAKPALQCNGKCYLKKELKKAMEEESAKKEISQKTLETESLPITLELDFTSHYLYIQKLQFPAIEQSLLSPALKNLTPPPKA